MILPSACTEEPSLRGQQAHQEESSVKRKAVALVREPPLLHSEQEYLRLPEAEMNIAEGVLILAKGLRPNLRIEEYLQKIDSFADELKPRLKPDMGPQETIATLNRYVFFEKGFKPNPTSEGRHFLDTVLDEHGGNCFGLSCLYLSLAERLGIPLFAVAAPEHFFVRYEHEGTKINIETTANGKSMTDAEITAWLNVSRTSLEKEVFMQPLSKPQILGAMLCSRGRAFDDRGDYQKALLDYSASITLQPKNPTAYNNRGAVRAISGDSENALRDYDTALSLDPHYAKAYSGRANCFLERGKYEKGLEDINKALELDPKQADAYNSRGLIALQQRQYPSAISDFSRALAVRDDYAEAYFNRAIAESMAGNKQAMIADLTKAIALDARLKHHATASPGFAQWREDSSFTRLAALTARATPGPSSPLKEFPLLYLYFDTFPEIDAAERAGQLQIAIHANDARSRNYSVEQVIINERLFLSLYSQDLLRVRLSDGFEMFQSVEKDYWDRAANPEKYAGELHSQSEHSRELRREIDVHVKAIRIRYGL